jgi:hypothetical protein
VSTAEAVEYLKIIEASFNPKTAPRFDKDKIEGERDKARQALALAMSSLAKGR